MKIKRFTAPDVRQALRRVRDEMGPDAVIVSSRRAEGGVAVFAAVDYEAAVSAQAEEPPAAVDAPAPVQRIATARSAYAEQATADEDWPAPPGVPASRAGAVDAMRSEMQRMRELLEGQLASLAWNELGRSQPMRATVLRDLSSVGWPWRSTPGTGRSSTS
jgi:flagellar biosynthesis protein FlhF